jgi:hypothetical protein
MQVQHWLPDVPEGEKDSHTGVVCLACSKRHFIHKTTEK